MIAFLVFCAFASLLSSLQLFETTDRNNKPYKVVCYYDSWAVYRPGAGKFLVESIVSNICTHLVYAFVGLHTIRILDSYHALPDGGKNAFERFNNRKNVNPNLSTIVAIGGWNEGSTKYSVLAATRETRQIFINSVVEFLERWGFDGLDMNWDYPGSKGGKADDKVNFVTLLKELKEAFAPHELLLSATVSGVKAIMEAGYNIREMAKHLDFINVMTFDYHGSWENTTGHTSPLYARPEETGALLNVNYSINYWIDQGAPREKIILGMGLYGRAFTLQRAEDHGLEALAPQAGQRGPYTREPGMLGYNEICESITKGEKWTVVWVDHYEAPYAYKDRQWVGYDDPRSIQIKVDYIKKMGLGGGMVWSIDTDDFRGICYGISFPLTKTVYKKLIGDITVSNQVADGE